VYVSSSSSSSSSSYKLLQTTVTTTTTTTTDMLHQGFTEGVAGCRSVHSQLDNAWMVGGGQKKE